MPYDNYIHETTPYEELLYYVNSVLYKTPGEKESFEKKAHEILVSLRKEAEENLRTDHTKEQIREFYEKKFADLQEQLRNQPKQLLTSYCKSRRLPCSSDEELLSSLDGNSWENFSREEWEDVLKGNLEREDYLEVPLFLEMSVQEAERFITETSNFGFDYNDPENLIAIFALALNDTDESLTEEEFGSLHLYYKNLAKKKTQKLTYNELLKSPNAAANTKVNKDSVVNNFRSVAKERGKNVALQEMKDFLKKRFGRLNGVSLRATSLLQHVAECTQVTPTANAKPINDFLNDQRRTPYKGKEAKEKASKMAKNISLLYTRPYTLTEADTDLLSKGRVHLSQYYCVDSNGKVEEQAPQSFDSLLRGKVKPTKADFLAALYRACITNWWDIGSVEAENISAHFTEFFEVATAVLREAMLPPFIAENPLEQCYLFAIIAFHEGLVLYFTQRSDAGKKHKGSMTQKQKDLNESKVAKKYYSEAVRECLGENRKIMDLYQKFRADFANEVTAAKRDNKKTFSCILNRDKECVFSQKFIEKLCENEAFEPLITKIENAGLEDDNSGKEIIKKHVTWMILSFYTDQIFSDEKINPKNLKTTINTKKNLKITFRK